jgi:hypothetical protein
MGHFLRDWDDRVGEPRPDGIKYHASGFTASNASQTSDIYGEPIRTEKWTWKARSIQRAPAMLFTSRESRPLAMEVYAPVGVFFF